MTDFDQFSPTVGDPTIRTPKSHRMVVRWLLRCAAVGETVPLKATAPLTQLFHLSENFLAEAAAVVCGGGGAPKAAAGDDMDKRLKALERAQSAGGGGGGAAPGAGGGAAHGGGGGAAAHGGGGGARGGGGATSVAKLAPLADGAKKVPHALKGARLEAPASEMGVSTAKNPFTKDKPCVYCGVAGCEKKNVPDAHAAYFALLPTKATVLDHYNHVIKQGAQPRA